MKSQLVCSWLVPSTLATPTQIIPASCMCAHISIKPRPHWWTSRRQKHRWLHLKALHCCCFLSCQETFWRGQELCCAEDSNLDLVWWGTDRVCKGQHTIEGVPQRVCYTMERPLPSDQSSCMIGFAVH